MKEQNADNKSKVTVKVPRRLTAILDKVQERSQFTSPAKLAASCVEDEISDIETELNEIKHAVDLIDQLPFFQHGDVINSDILSVSTGNLNASLTVKIPKDKYEALKQAESYTSMSRSDIMRACIAIHMDKMVSNGDFDSDGMKVLLIDIRDMVDEANLKIGLIEATSERVLEYNFVDGRDMLVRRLKDDPKQSRILRGTYNESLKGSEIIKEFDRDLVDSIESVFDEVGV